MSFVYIALPVTTSRASSRVVGTPIRVSCALAFNVAGTAGTAMPAAAPASSPNVALRPLGDGGAARAQPAGGNAPLLRGGGDEASASPRRGRAHRLVERVDGVGAAGELVEQQLRTGVFEDRLGVGQIGAELVGDNHGERRRETLPYLGTRQTHDHLVLRRDLDDEQAHRRLSRQREGVGEVEDVGHTRRRCGRLGADDVVDDLHPDGQGWSGHQIGQQAPTSHPLGFRLHLLAPQPSRIDDVVRHLPYPRLRVFWRAPRSPHGPGHIVYATAVVAG